MPALHKKPLEDFAVGYWESNIEPVPAKPNAEMDVATRNAHCRLSLKADKTFVFTYEERKVSGKYSVADRQIRFVPNDVEGKSLDFVRREGKVYESLQRFQTPSSSRLALDLSPIMRARALKTLEDMGALKPDDDELRLTQVAPKGDLAMYWYRRE